MFRDEAGWTLTITTERVDRGDYTLRRVTSAAGARHLTFLHGLVDTPEVVPGAGHWLPVDAPDVVATSLDTWWTDGP